MCASEQTLRANARMLGASSDELRDRTLNCCIRITPRLRGEPI